MSDQFAAERPGAPHDPFAEPMKVIKERLRASAAVLQRGLSIGYTTAVRVLDDMTQAGLLGPDRIGGDRELLFIKAEDEADRVLGASIRALLAAERKSMYPNASPSWPAEIVIKRYEVDVNDQPQPPEYRCHVSGGSSLGHPTLDEAVAKAKPGVVGV